MQMSLLLVLFLADEALGVIESTSQQLEGNMESIGAFDAKTRLSELLERTEQGEAFQITKHGRPVGKLVPPDNSRDPQAIAAAVQRLKNMRGLFGPMSKKEALSLKHAGHRF